MARSASGGGLVVVARVRSALAPASNPWPPGGISPRRARPGRRRFAADRRMRIRMPGSGTDKTKPWTEVAGPIVVLVEPQLGQNIGTAARAMANFGLSRLRLVKPRDGWPNIRAKRAASGADRILDGAVLYDTVEAAIGDCTVVLATTARAHDQAKPVIGAEQAARELAPHVAA